ncbi:hypothetical protein BC832DRAFT_240249 [Gaertneriomyces semiglobifer]|nr:hypothetical protein BC832DRAFT_240249 [Gaertneriomyces semiglobifer]
MLSAQGYQQNSGIAYDDRAGPGMQPPNGVDGAPSGFQISLDDDSTEAEPGFADAPIVGRSRGHQRAASASSLSKYRRSRRRPPSNPDPSDLPDLVEDIVASFSPAVVASSPVLGQYLDTILSRFARWQARGRSVAASYEAACIGGKVFLDERGYQRVDAAADLADEAVARLLAGIVVDRVDHTASSEWDGAVRDKAIAIVADEFKQKAIRREQVQGILPDTPYSYPEATRQREQAPSDFSNTFSKDDDALSGSAVERWPAPFTETYSPYLSGNESGDGLGQAGRRRGFTSEKSVQIPVYNISRPGPPSTAPGVFSTARKSSASSDSSITLTPVSPSLNYAGGNLRRPSLNEPFRRPSIASETDARSGLYRPLPYDGLLPSGVFRRRGSREDEFLSSSSPIGEGAPRVPKVPREPLVKGVIPQRLESRVMLQQQQQQQQFALGANALPTNVQPSIISQPVELPREEPKKNEKRGGSADVVLLGGPPIRNKDDAKKESLRNPRGESSGWKRLLRP